MSAREVLAAAQYELLSNDETFGPDEVLDALRAAGYVVLLRESVDALARSGGDR